jgi:diguanylate cyclase (GGDEF)-like protein
MGDHVLVLVAHIFKSQIRNTDTFARLGGDEFGLLLPETDGNDAYLMIERVRQLLNAQAIETGKDAITISISAGVTAFNLHAQETFDSLMARADQALYHSKESGRNFVSLALP